VESDGSAHFKVPALRSIYFAILDESGRSVKQMRSFVTLQPGETLGCVGCHEPRARAPHSRNRPLLQALARPPSRIEPIADVPSVMEFPRDIQPILDRHCAPCHNHEKREGGLVLTGDRGPVYSLSYYELYLFWQIKDTSGDPAHGSGRQPGDDSPYSTYSSASALMNKIDGDHHEVELSAWDKKMVRLWIDTGATYAGTYSAYGTGQIGGCWGNNVPERVMLDSLPSTRSAQEAVQRRCASCHGRLLPRHVTDQIPLDPWEDMLSWVRPLSRFSRHRLFNLSQPDKSLILLAPLAHQNGGYAEVELVDSDGKPRLITENRALSPQPVRHPIVFASPGDADYQKILAHIKAAQAKLNQIKRFDMPDFKPNQHYVREMKRYGVLPAAFDLAKDPIDVHATDQAYWRSLWHRPE
jgi:cytochrome c553